MMLHRKIQQNKKMVKQNNIFLHNVAEYRDKTLFDGALNQLPEERKQKVLQCKNQDAKRLSLGAGVLLGKALESKGITEKDLRFAYGEQGKPYLADYPNVHFSLSHSGEMVMCVIADCETGCDIEQIHPRKYDHIAKRFFTKKEYQSVIGQTNEEMCREMFYRYWTLKESFLKTTGKGISLPLDSFEFDLSAADNIGFSWPGHTEKYEFSEIKLDGYKAAVCCECV